jgi:predicted RNA-binding Zn ribbon-like protein
MSRPGLSIDFANTRFWRGSAAPTEQLGTREALRAWCRSQGLPDVAWSEGQFVEALALREAIYGVFAAASAGTAPAKTDLDRLNRALDTAPARRRLARTAGHYGWDVGKLDATPLAPVVWSAADLLTQPLIERVRLCANEKCLWLFLDESKSGNRRWCSMSACGNRAKAHRHYARQKEK